MTLDDLVNVFDEAARTCNLKNANRGKYEQQKEGERAGIVAVVRALGPTIERAIAWRDDCRDKEYLRRTAGFFINDILSDAEVQAGASKSNPEERPSAVFSTISATTNAVLATPAAYYCDCPMQGPSYKGVCIACKKPSKFVDANRLPMPAIRSEG